MSAASPVAFKKHVKKKRHGKKPTAAPPTSARRFGAPRRILRQLWPATTRSGWMMVCVLAVAFGFRVARLMEMFPILVDESIYLHWAEIIEHQGQWFISLLDGKQPLQYWVLAVVRMILGGDPLLESRLVAVGVGLLSTIGVFAIGKRLGGDTAGLISASLYAVFPFAVLYDRLAYTEAFVNLNGITIALTALFAFREPKKNWAARDRRRRRARTGSVYQADRAALRLFSGNRGAVARTWTSQESAREGGAHLRNCGRFCSHHLGGDSRGPDVGDS